MPKSKIGKVAGFVLIVDPKNQQGQKQEMEFDNLRAPVARAKEIGLAYSILTVFEDYDGEREMQEGYSILAVVGGFAYKHACKNCKSIIGWTTSGMRDPVRGLCYSCLNQEQEDADIDVDSVYDRQARRDEY